MHLGLNSTLSNTRTAISAIILFDFPLYTLVHPFVFGLSPSLLLGLTLSTNLKIFFSIYINIYWYKLHIWSQFSHIMFYLWCFPYLVHFFLLWSAPWSFCSFVMQEILEFCFCGYLYTNIFSNVLNLPFPHFGYPLIPSKDITGGRGFASWLYHVRMVGSCSTPTFSVAHILQGLTASSISSQRCHHPPPDGFVALQRDSSPWTAFLRGTLKVPLANF